MARRKKMFSREELIVGVILFMRFVDKKEYLQSHLLRCCSKELQTGRWLFMDMWPFAKLLNLFSALKKLRLNSGTAGFRY